MGRSKRIGQSREQPLDWVVMEVLKTPEESFQGLEGYPFFPHYIEVAPGLRMHYLDEGKGSRTLLLMHGEPSWSYLYRKMIPIFVRSGYRILAPDLIGFGKSDKPANPADYSYERHLAWLQSFLDKLELNSLDLVCQDWGGLLGLRLVAANESKFSTVTAANTFLPTGDIPPNEDFLKWQKFSQITKKLPVGRIIQNGCVGKLSPEVLAGYEAPFPDESLKMGARIFPSLVPTSPDDPASGANRNAWKILENWKKPFLTAFSDSDPITKGGDIIFRRKIPGAKGQPHTTIKDAGHFLQEDKGEEFAEVICSFLKSL